MSTRYRTAGTHNHTALRTRWRYSRLCINMSCCLLANTRENIQAEINKEEWNLWMMITKLFHGECRWNLNWQLGLFETPWQTWNDEKDKIVLFNCWWVLDFLEPLGRSKKNEYKARTIKLRSYPKPYVLGFELISIQTLYVLQNTNTGVV
jgi:hypothetical protein